MPDPNDFDDEDSFLEVCIPAVMDEGKDQKAAVGQCKGMWRNRKKTKKSDGAADLAGNILDPDTLASVKEK
jgi:hypothetical protein